MKKTWFTYFIYISIIFLIIALIKADYLQIPKQIKIGYLIASLLLLFLGTIFQALSYKIILRAYDCKIYAKDAIKCFGMVAFLKYIPGKFWIHLGIAGYINKYYKYPIDRLIIIGLNLQLVSMWVVLTLSSIGILFFNIPELMKATAMVAWIIISLAIFTKYFHKSIQWLFKILIKKDLSIPNLSFMGNIKIFPICILFWVVYGIAFYFLCLSLNTNLGYRAVIYFPLSAIIGIIMILSPGGIGFREGTLVLLLTSGGVTTAIATTIALFSRLWFLIGEFFIFILGLLIRRPKLN